MTRPGRHHRQDDRHGHEVHGIARRVQIASILNAAISGGLSAYDAEFVALARHLDVPLVTTDLAILEAAPDVAVALSRYA